MPRPKPLVALHGAVNFDKLVPFDSAPNAPPLANNDILVMRKAAGGDNLTLQISDINATGSVNIAQLLGGANNDMLSRVGGVWTGTGPSGLTYDGSSLNLDGDDLSIEGGGGIDIEGGGGISIETGGGIAFEGGGGVTIEDGGGILLEGDGNVEIADAGNLELSGQGNIVISGSGQILANLGTQALPGFAFDGDPDTGIFGFGSGQVIFTTNGVQQFIVTPGSFSGTLANAPILRNLAASSTVPNIVISSGDVNTGIGTAGADILSHIAGGVEGFRVAEVGGIITNTIFGDLIAAGGGGAGPAMRNVGASATVPPFTPNQADPDTGFTRSGVNQAGVVCGGAEAARFRSTTASIATFTNFGLFDYDNGQIELVSVGAADSGGAGFKLLRIAN